MSKYTTFHDITFLDKACLIAALAALGFGPEKVEQGENLPLYGYKGDRRKETAAIVIRKTFVGHAANDVGFALTAAGYVPIVSEFDQGSFLGGSFLTRIKAEYKVAGIEKIAVAKHGSVLRRVEGAKRVITVRW